MLKVLTSVRKFSSSNRLFRKTDPIKGAFVKKIREYAEKVDSGRLLQPSEMNNMLEDELNRLANKFHMENSAVVEELPSKFAPSEVDSAVQKILEGKSLDQLIADVKKETADYLTQRKAKAMEAARRAALLKSDMTDSPGVVKSA